MKSLRSIEGLFEKDERHSGGKHTEMPVVTCCHCHVQVVLNPLRTRERNFCRSCFRYVCDSPACRECNGSLNRVLDKMQDKLINKLPLF